MAVTPNDHSAPTPHTGRSAASAAGSPFDATRASVPGADRLDDAILQSRDHNGTTVAAHLEALHGRTDIQTILCGLLAAGGNYGPSTSPALVTYVAWAQAAALNPAAVARIVRELTLTGRSDIEITPRPLNTPQDIVSYERCIAVEDPAKTTSRDVFEKSILRYLTPPYYVLNESTGKPFYVYDERQTPGLPPPALGENVLIRPAHLTVFSLARFVGDISGKEIIALTGALAKEVAVELTATGEVSPSCFALIGHESDSGRVVISAPLSKDVVESGSTDAVLVVKPRDILLSAELAPRFQTVLMFRNLIEGERERRYLHPRQFDRESWSNLSDTAIDRFKALVDIAYGVRYDEFQKTRDRQEKMRRPVESVLRAGNHGSDSELGTKEVHGAALRDAQEHLLAIIGSGDLGHSGYEMFLSATMINAFRRKDDGERVKSDLNHIALKAFEVLNHYGCHPHSVALVRAVRDIDSPHALAAWCQFIVCHTTFETCLAGVCGWAAPLSTNSRSPDGTSDARLTRTKQYSVTALPPPDEANAPQFTGIKTLLSSDRFRPTLTNGTFGSNLGTWGLVQELFGKATVAPSTVRDNRINPDDPIPNGGFPAADAGKALPAMFFLASPGASTSAVAFNVAVGTLMQRPFGQIWLADLMTRKSAEWLDTSNVLAGFLDTLATRDADAVASSSNPGLDELVNHMPSPQAAQKQTAVAVEWDRLAPVFAKADSSELLRARLTDHVTRKLSRWTTEQVIEAYLALDGISSPSLRPIQLAIHAKLMDTLAAASLDPNGGIALLEYAAARLDVRSREWIIDQGLRPGAKRGSPEYCAAIGLASALDAQGKNVTCVCDVPGKRSTVNIAAIRSEVVEKFRRYRRDVFAAPPLQLADEFRAVVAVLNSERNLPKFVYRNTWAMNGLLADAEPDIRMAAATMLTKLQGMEGLLPEAGTPPPRPGLGKQVINYFRLWGVLDNAKPSPSMPNIS